MFGAYTDASLKAMENLRSTAHFGWYLVALAQRLADNRGLLLRFCALPAVLRLEKALEVEGRADDGVYAFDLLAVILFVWILKWI